MRLIDANALKKEIRENDPFGGMNYEWYIDHAPTIASAPCWHKVDEPPKKNGRYLVTWEGVVTTDEYKNGVWLYASMFNQRVTYWMPIPEPPKEDA